MGRQRLMRWLVVLVVPTMMLVASCASKSGQPGPDGAATSQQMTEEEAARVAAEEKAQQEEQARIESERIAAEEAAEEQRMMEVKKQAKAAFVNRNIHYSFDSFALSPEARAILDDKVEWLRSNPSAMVTVEGHCDERGTREYNLALGDRRAKSAKKYLVDSGIAGSRIATISYGEERPLENSKSEMAWAKNRRAQFVIR